MGERVFLHPAVVRQQFVDFISRPIGWADLARGALLVALEEYPSLDPDVYVRELDAMAGRIAAKSEPGEPDVFRLGHLHAEMFDREGYGGNVQAYYDPRNSFLNEVIDRRVGIPITLSIIFLHLANRIGLQAVGVGLPGHYVVRVQFELNEIYVDPFQNGETLMLGDIGAIIREMSGGALTLKPEHLRPWTPRQTLLRVLANLETIYRRTDDRRRAEAARERIDLLMATTTNGGGM
jgi:regulator of sirC expression with transglutaminase-like and TPR domain